MKKREELESHNLPYETSKSLSNISEREISDETDPFEKIIKSSIGKYIKSFLNFLEDEVKKFSSFYINIEKEIYCKMNSHLYTHHHTFEDYSLNEIFEELNQLQKLILEILEVANFINLNLTAVRKILKKFDKKFELQNNPVALHFLKQKLRDSSSSLVYILQFKIIDESSAIIERSLKNLESEYNKKKQVLNTKGEAEEMMGEPLLKEMNISMLSGGLHAEEVEKMYEERFKKIRALNEQIDESNNLIRSNVVFWSLNSFKTEFDMRRIEEYKDVMLEYIEEEKILENLLPQVEGGVEVSKGEKIYQMNIWLTLMHTFLFTMNGFIVQPSNPLYLARLNASPFLTGIILGMTPLAAVVSTFGYSYLVNKGYRHTYYISLLSLICGNFLYSYADSVNSVMVMATGRIFVGFGGARVVNRRYLIEQVPDRMIMHYSLLYVIMICLGMAAGPAIALVLFNIPEFTLTSINLNFNPYTNPGWICMALWVIFSFILLSLFDDNAIKYHGSISADIENRTPPAGGTFESREKVEKCVKEIKKLNQNFTNVNLVEKDIESLIKEEEETFSYLSIAFTLLSVILITSRMTAECLFILSPLILPHYYGLSPSAISLFLCTVSLMVLPIGFLVNNISKSTQERYLIKVFHFVNIGCCFLLIRFDFFFHLQFPLFFILFSILFVSSNILESVDSALLTKIMPSNHLGMHRIMNPGLMIILTTTVGRFFGCLIVSIFGVFGYDYIQSTIFFFMFMVHLVIQLMVTYFYSDLRVKAISRIIKKKYIN